MMDLGDNPVTLIVKAPNQRIADQTVDCFLEWTVRKLKEHLENVYPSKPKHSLQKLIYSGKLLQDHFTLKEVLRQLDEASLHTVHLVCAGGSEGSYVESTSETQIDATPSSSSHSTDSTEGIRYRGPTMPGMEQLQLGGNMMAPPMMMPPGYGGYSPEQYSGCSRCTPSIDTVHAIVSTCPNTCNSEYLSQVLTQYMQYYNNAYHQTPPATPATAAAAEGRPANQNQPNNAPAAPAQANPNMRMNAQGGMVEDEDEEDVEHRDWLDYIYSYSRFLVLLSIVYFYSTFSRFVAVFIGFVIIYFLQKGWLNIRRNPNPPQRQQQPAEAAPEVVPQEAEQQPQQQQQANPAENPQGIIAMVWCFVSTFITSLVPQQPPAVNAN
ncbi:LOW QUALITY PROTEIN: homocysteine-responsive endoplasmic reticulum-resident ubiquitin-like domain member 2 protein [Haliotis rubra]|uniref:LOW QUALITY PROTEIN: homocysteine-responsive endoplasmic reticulum-resident ubiquitin-like domain member 2 protein n=1 Tax=Haliotis rubra TaxID=36100 RepID=UPI001EE60474|nr:LOW QUALITY PROTEIN: homocysteine-responsive endoplasmic reticulum-resident ubiquitin-like domain member 2 protein [Haliotis rubra]